METVQRITGWIPGSAEHSVIQVTDDGIHFEGVVLGGSLEEPFAIRYAVMADPEGRCRESRRGHSGTRSCSSCSPTERADGRMPMARSSASSKARLTSTSESRR